MRNSREIHEQQLDLFLIHLAPCGRGLGPCVAQIEADQIRCITCGCVAPHPNSRDSRDLPPDSSGQ
jgi:hypothetical protein